MNCGLQAGKKQMLVCRWICSFFWLSQGTSRGTARSLAIAASALKPQQTSQRLKEFGRRKSSNFFLCSRICVPSRLDASQNMGYLPTLIQLTLFTGAVCPSNVKIQVPIIVSITISAVFMQAKLRKWMETSVTFDRPQDYLPICLLFPCETGGEVAITSKVTWSFIPNTYLNLGNPGWKSDEPICPSLLLGSIISIEKQTNKPYCSFLDNKLIHCK